MTFSKRMAVSPGKKKFGERESGLKSNLGRMSTAKGAVLSVTTRRKDSSRPMAVATLMAWPATEESEPSISTRTCADIPWMSLSE